MIYFIDICKPSSGGAGVPTWSAAAERNNNWAANGETIIVGMMMVMMVVMMVIMMVVMMMVMMMVMMVIMMVVMMMVMVVVIIFLETKH